MTQIALFHITSLVAVAQAITTSEIFARPVQLRMYEAEQYALADANRHDGLRVDVATIGSSIAALQPSYVSGSLSLRYGTNLTSDMINDFNTIRTSVRASSPNVKFDVLIELNPETFDGKATFPDTNSVLSLMAVIDSKLHLDAWWFDFYSTAYKAKPEWVTAVNNYAHTHNQTVGGNVFGNIVPPSADAVSFVDDRWNTSNVYDGFGINAREVNLLKKNASSTIILGHLQSNPQNGNSTESCVYQYDWNSTRRASYLDYWYQQQSQLGFTFMMPLFYPLCPGAYSFDPLSDTLPAGVGGLSGNSNTLYDYIMALSNGTAAVGPSGTALVSSTTASSTAQPTTSSSSAPGQSRGVGLLILFVPLLTMLYWA